MDAEWIGRQIILGSYELSAHAEDERQAEQILIADIECALMNAEILEDYPDDPRGASCLVLGYAISGHPIHIVCGQTPSARLRLITVYIPSPPKWLNERTRRR